MRRVVAVLLLACTALFAGGLAALAQDGDPSPSTSPRAPLRPFDPPEPEPVFIPDLVSDLVLTDLGQGLDVSRLAANPSGRAPGTGGLFDWPAWIEFAMPAAVPLLIALAVLGLTRVPRYHSSEEAVDAATRHGPG